MAGDGAQAVAGGCTIAASAIATWHIYKHLCNYTEPMYQRYTVRIIFMIHVYGLMSFLALVRPAEAIYYNSICGTYEAWVIYNFLSLCIAFIGGPGAVATSLQGRYLKPSWHLMTCCCDAIPLDGVFIRRCKQGVLQFAILKPLLVGATLVLYESGVYEDGRFSISSSYLYITIMYTFSYTLALAALVLFYVACKDMLQPFQPLPKFLIIKSIVFLTYWQGVVIALLANGGIIKRAQGALDVQNITICVEMLFAAIGHLHAFPYDVYSDANVNGQVGSLWRNILHALNFADLVYDTMHQFAPTYHEYVLYSDGSQDAPQRYQVRTFVPTRQARLEEEIEASKDSMSMRWQPVLSFGVDAKGATRINVMSHDKDQVTEVAVATRPDEVQSTTTASCISVGTNARPHYIMASLGSNCNVIKPVLGGRIQSSSINDTDFNPHTYSLGDPVDPLATPYRQWGKSFEDVASPDNEIIELTKLTNRRESEHGPLMDTIDLRGENEEYSEGFIQR